MSRKVEAVSDSKASKSAFKPRRLIDVKEAEIKYLWAGRIPRGCLTLVEGDGGVGKSTIIAAIGGALTAGHALPGDVLKAPINILLIAHEDDPGSVLRPRFRLNGADLERVHFFDEPGAIDREYVAKLRDFVVEHAIELVVIDPVVAFLGTNLDMSKGNDVRSFMGPLATLAKDLEIAVVIVRHFNKNLSAQASHRGSGSVDFRNASRSVLQVVKAEEQSYVSLEKTNYAALAKTLLFQIKGGSVEWLGESELSADQILAHAREGVETIGALDEAIEFLREALADGAVESKLLIAQADEVGISSASLRRAKKKLAVKSFKPTGGNVFFADYQPGERPVDGAQASQAEELEHHRSLEHHRPTLKPKSNKKVLDHAAREVV